MKPLIGIPAAEYQFSGNTWSSVIYGQRHTYCDAVLHAGGVPIIMPLISDIATLSQLYQLCDGILLAGGRDVNPSRYGQEPYTETEESNNVQDAQEFQILEWALKDDKPVLGICRGMQILNIHKGGTLYQHIPTDLPKAQNHETSEAHEDTTFIAHVLRLRPESQLAKIVGMVPLPTNSQHHQATKELGDGLVATAWAEDGVIEAIELPESHFVIATESHPEGLEAEAEPRWRKLFEAFVIASANGRD